MALLDLIEYPNEGTDEIVHRIPEQGSGEFRLGSQLVVRESQKAVFFRDGKALDVFGPGRYTISTNNLPLLTGLLGAAFGGKSPFRAEVYFVSMREFTDMKWGTPQPMTYRDSQLGMVRLRAFGTYSMRVDDAQLLVTTVVGARGEYSTSAIDDFLRSIIVSQFNDVLGTVQTTLLDLPKLTNEIAATTRNSLTDQFKQFGFALTSFQILSITPPDDVQKMIDERSGMGAVGNLGAYMQYKTAQAIGEAAQNPGAGGQAASTGVGLGAGLGLGQAMAQSMREAMSPQQQQQAPAQSDLPPASTMVCPHCHTTIPAGSKFCPNCGQALPTVNKCPKCGTENPPGAKFCTNCGTALTSQ